MRGQKSTEHYERCVARFDAIADTQRLMILATLLEGPASVVELAKKTQSDAAKTSQELRILMIAGLVTMARGDSRAIYSLAPDVAAPAMRDVPARLNLGSFKLEFNSAQPATAKYA